MGERPARNRCPSSPASAPAAGRGRARCRMV